MCCFNATIALLEDFMSDIKINIKDFNKVMDEINKREPSEKEVKDLFEILESENQNQVADDDRKIAKNREDYVIEQTRV